MFDCVAYTNQIKIPVALFCRWDSIALHSRALRSKQAYQMSVLIHLLHFHLSRISKSKPLHCHHKDETSEKGNVELHIIAHRTCRFLPQLHMTKPLCVCVLFFVSVENVFISFAKADDPFEPQHTAAQYLLTTVTTDNHIEFACLAVQIDMHDGEQ